MQISGRHQHLLSHVIITWAPEQDCHHRLLAQPELCAHHQHHSPRAHHLASSQVIPQALCSSDILPQLQTYMPHNHEALELLDAQQMRGYHRSLTHSGLHCSANIAIKQMSLLAAWDSLSAAARGDSAEQ